MPVCGIDADADGDSDTDDDEDCCWRLSVPRTTGGSCVAASSPGAAGALPWSCLLLRDSFWHDCDATLPEDSPRLSASDGDDDDDDDDDDGDVEDEPP